MKKNSLLRRLVFVTTLMLLSLLLVLAASWTYFLLHRPHPQVDYFDLAMHYAPVIHQGAVSEQDFITRVDYDGDWIGNNNWDNFPTGDLRAYVYYSVRETETHYYIQYALFHARDTSLFDCDKIPDCHENDLEAAQLMIRKDETTYGRLLAFETIAHRQMYLYSADQSVQSGTLTALLPEPLENGRIALLVEPYGHGIRSHQVLQLPSSSMITYLPAYEAQLPVLPMKGESTWVNYALLSTADTLWIHRAASGDGLLYDQNFSYNGCEIPANFDGNTYQADAANTPWGFDQAMEAGLGQGDWFFDPAKVFTTHATINGKVDKTYRDKKFNLECR